MCRATNCRRCGKTTWAGCGAHVDAVMQGVPASNRCTCREDSVASGAKSSGGWLGSRFGRKAAS